MKLPQLQLVFMRWQLILSKSIHMQEKGKRVHVSRTTQIWKFETTYTRTRKLITSWFATIRSTSDHNVSLNLNKGADCFERN